jgi:membrane protease YdiL (CAAX protease family)
MEPDSAYPSEPQELPAITVSLEDIRALDPPKSAGPGGWGYGELAVVVLLAVLSYVFFLVAYGVFIAATGQSVNLEDIGSIAPALITIQVVWSALILFLIHLVVTRRYTKPFASAIGWTWPQEPWTRFAISGFSLAIMIAVAGSVLPAPEHELPMEALLKSTSNLVFLGVFAIVFAPPFEELVFRGFLFPVFESAHGAPVAVAATAALFSLLHGSQYGWHWPHLLLLLAVGVVFGVIRASTKSVLACAIMHAAYNATLVGGALVARAVMGEQA